MTKMTSRFVLPVPNGRGLSFPFIECNFRIYVVHLAPGSVWDFLAAGILLRSTTSDDSNFKPRPSDGRSHSTSSASEKRLVGRLKSRFCTASERRVDVT